mmetsp:Transcript_1273/g.2121  ORF Transcript_1273/g.2121 Transcript_1273/m.2121 type:complete len:491 (-) Transcript_1273:97-1569(-)|eukprot:CAMPEP_0184292098 /NCGR_PEP_ID=MMETSP1049-20130417/3943_1 /TAXON_ID=77928 /ORGANISM="Proteomonas sulcata, Strain CCMP704" /LENGTH=490 /DNA_ID=CAMNT_0026599749 /DNA_START=296 /DNA_END=1768 /DNA_ORIENTATION=-
MCKTEPNVDISATASCETLEGARALLSVAEAGAANKALLNLAPRFAVGAKSQSTMSLLESLTAASSAAGSFPSRMSSTASAPEQSEASRSMGVATLDNNMRFVKGNEAMEELLPGLSGGQLVLPALGLQESNISASSLPPAGLQANVTLASGIEASLSLAPAPPGVCMLLMPTNQPSQPSRKRSAEVTVKIEEPAAKRQAVASTNASKDALHPLLHGLKALEALSDTKDTNNSALSALLQHSAHAQAAQQEQPAVQSSQGLNPLLLQQAGNMGLSTLSLGSVPEYLSAMNSQMPVPLINSLPQQQPQLGTGLNADGTQLNLMQQLQMQQTIQMQKQRLTALTMQISSLQALLGAHAATEPPKLRADSPDQESWRKVAEQLRSGSSDSDSSKSPLDAKELKSMKKSGSQRNATIRWTKDEHIAFLQGLEKLGIGQWSSISKQFVPSRTPAQVASHHQKFAIRSNLPAEERQKPSVLDITTPAVQRLVAGQS